jgi:SAM-dependent methyltransferase
MRRPPELACPEHRSALEDCGAELRCAGGCRFPVLAGIPRFVASSGYASAFGLQWKTFRRTQLDSHTGTTISRDRLARCLGGSLDVVRGRSVLEVGCGAGRFTELLLQAGARVFACDLSDAVEANLANCGRHADYFVCQADVLALPAAPRSFDFVVALGMLQHTPSPEDAIKALAAMLKPGALLSVDHYAPLQNPALRLLATLLPRALLRRALLRLPPEQALRSASFFSRTLLPAHRALWRRGRGARWGRSLLRLASPVLDYYDRFPELAPAHLEEWALLDTFDALTDRYKHVRTPDQIARALRAAGLDVASCRRAGNGVEALARAA